MIEEQNVILVDHNDFAQSVDGIEKAKIIGVIDHHRIGNFRTAEPLYYTARPYGCTSTILYKEFIEKAIEPMEKSAGRTTFMRSASGMDKIWKELDEEGLRYVGEWHSHPNGSIQYSSTDLAAMTDIENEVSIENPLVLSDYPQSGLCVAECS